MTRILSQIILGLAIPFMLMAVLPALIAAGLIWPDLG